MKKLSMRVRFFTAVLLTGTLLGLHQPITVAAQEPGNGDTDQDGIPDSEDNCPNVFNPIQLERGDGDGIGDACDPDDDGDEVGDADDNCPAIPNHDQQDADGDRIGDTCDTAPLISPRTLLPFAGIVIIIVLVGWFLIRIRRRTRQSDTGPGDVS